MRPRTVPLPQAQQQQRFTLFAKPQDNSVRMKLEFGDEKRMALFNKPVMLDTVRSHVFTTFGQPLISTTTTQRHQDHQLIGCQERLGRSCLHPPVPVSCSQHEDSPCPPYHSNQWSLSPPFPSPTSPIDEQISSFPLSSRLFCECGHGARHIGSWCQTRVVMGPDTWGHGARHVGSRCRTHGVHGAGHTGSRCQTHGVTVSDMCRQCIVCQGLCGSTSEPYAYLKEQETEPHVPPAPKDYQLEGDLKGEPDGLKGVPDGLKGEPDGLKGMPDGLKGMPDGLKGEPDGLKGMPDGLKGMPDGLKGVPDALCAPSPEPSVKSIPSTPSEFTYDSRSPPDSLSWSNEMQQRNGPHLYDGIEGMYTPDEDDLASMQTRTYPRERQRATAWRSAKTRSHVRA
eukprot:Em0012g667a